MNPDPRTWRRVAIVGSLALVALVALPGPAGAAGLHLGWCIGVGNKHGGNGCSAGLPSTQTSGTTTPVPTVTTTTPVQTSPNRPTPQVVTVTAGHPATIAELQTPAQVVVAPPLTLVLQAGDVPRPQPQQPAQTSTNTPPLLVPPRPTQQAQPVATPNPQTPPTVAVPALKPPLPPGTTPTPTATPNPQTPPVQNVPTLQPPLPSTGTPQQPVATPNPQTPPTVAVPTLKPPLPPGTTTTPTATPNPQTPPLAVPLLRPPLPATTGPSTTPGVQTPAGTSQSSPVVVVPQGPGTRPIPSPSGGGGPTATGTADPTTTAGMRPPVTQPQGPGVPNGPNWVVSLPGRQPAHALPTVTDTVQAGRTHQCLVSGFGWRRERRADGSWALTGVHPELRTPEVLVRDIPANHPAHAGCVVQVERRHAATEKQR